MGLENIESLNDNTELFIRLFKLIKEYMTKYQTNFL